MRMWFLAGGGAIMNQDVYDEIAGIERSILNLSIETGVPVQQLFTLLLDLFRQELGNIL